MDKDRKVLTSLYCKIYNYSFNDRMTDKLATGQEIFDLDAEDIPSLYPLRFFFYLLPKIFHLLIDHILIAIYSSGCKV